MRARISQEPHLHETAWLGRCWHPRPGPIGRSAAHFGWGAGAPPEVPGGGTTFGSPVLGAGFWMAGSTSFGRMTPFDWFSSLLRFWAGGLASGTVFFCAALVAWAKAEPAMRTAPAAIRQSRMSMIRMPLERVGARTVPWATPGAPPKTSRTEGAASCPRTVIRGLTRPSTRSARRAIARKRRSHKALSVKAFRRSRRCRARPEAA
jgi:hypothetical protein